MPGSPAPPLIASALIGRTARSTSATASASTGTVRSLRSSAEPLRLEAEPFLFFQLSNPILGAYSHGATVFLPDQKIDHDAPGGGTGGTP